MYPSINRFVTRILPWIALIHIVLFVAYWLTNSLFYTSVNDYLIDLVGMQADFISIFLAIAASLGIWTGIRVFLDRMGLRHRWWTLTTWVYSLLAVLFIVFFYGSFWLLLSKSPVQFNRIGQLLGYFRLILDPVLLLGGTLLVSLWWIKRVQRPTQAGFKARLAGAWPILLLFVLIWALLPAFLPGSVYRGALPNKPLIIAHRGASFVAPENTLAALEKAAALGTYGVEVDICISQDGTLFLMHDDKLDRTTNVAQVFPGRETSRAESFSWAELQQLNAGEWYIQTDPYQSIARGMASAGEVAQYKNLVIPTLAEALAIVRKDKLIFIFDLKDPPANHPYRLKFFDLAFDQIHQAGIDPQVWFLVDSSQLAKVRAAAPAMRSAYGADYRQPPDPQELLAAGYQIVNAEYGLATGWIRTYHEAGLWVNLYTIDEPWQFSRLWLLGVESTTTSNAQAMVALDRPILSMPYASYQVFWAAIGMMGVGIILGIRAAGKSKQIG